ncbi:MAG: DNA methylase, partial [Clostridia bacterium]|nr:DNA methylase [Clostridia bacterium]
IKAYKPSANSIGSGQVLHEPYTFEKARIVLKEMADALALDLVNKGLTTDQIVITVGYDIENITDQSRKEKYKGEIVTDHYGRKKPKHAHGTFNLNGHTSSTKKIMDAACAIFDEKVDKSLLIHRLNVTACNVIDEISTAKNGSIKQLDLFTNYEKESAELEKEKKMQKALISIKKQFGKNAILKGLSFEEGATGKDRNDQIGGHKA